MHGHTLHRGTEPMAGSATAVIEPPRGPSGAVAWIDTNRALIARTSSAGGIDIREVRPADRRGELGPYLARVVDEIGDRDRIVILGPDAMRVELEREYVTINRRPDRLLDVENASDVDELALVDRLAGLTSS